MRGCAHNISRRSVVPERPTPMMKIGERTGSIRRDSYSTRAILGLAATAIVTPISSDDARSDGGTEALRHDVSMVEQDLFLVAQDLCPASNYRAVLASSVSSADSIFTFA